jgi:hypothetical protein
MSAQWPLTPYSSVRPSRTTVLSRNWAAAAGVVYKAEDVKLARFVDEIREPRACKEFSRNSAMRVVWGQDPVSSRQLKTSHDDIAQRVGNG